MTRYYFKDGDKEYKYEIIDWCANEFGDNWSDDSTWFHDNEMVRFNNNEDEMYFLLRWSDHIDTIQDIHDEINNDIKRLRKRFNIPKFERNPDELTEYIFANMSTLDLSMSALKRMNVIFWTDQDDWKDVIRIAFTNYKIRST